MRVVGRETFEMAGYDIDSIDKFDIYSCFPSAVQIACREMGEFPRRSARSHRNRRSALLWQAGKQLRHPFNCTDDGRGAREAGQQGYGDRKWQLRHEAIGWHLFSGTVHKAVRA